MGKLTGLEVWAGEYLKYLLSLGKLENLTFAYEDRLLKLRTRRRLAVTLRAISTIRRRTL